MGVTKTLGGDRLGSGKKMKVHMHGYERSTHNLDFLFRSTMSSGTLVPFLKKLMLPGDTFDVTLDVDLKTHPTVGPLFGSYKAQLDVFQVPLRLYQALLHNNALKIGLDMSQVKLPTITLQAPQFDDEEPNLDLDNSQVNPSCLLAYLGIRGMGLNRTLSTHIGRTFQCIPLLAYWDIYKNYYANKQEEIGAVIHSAIPGLEGTVDTITVTPSNPAISPFTIPANGSGIPPTFYDLQPGDVIELDWSVARPHPSTIMLLLSGQGLISFEQLVTAVVDDTPGTKYSGTYDYSRWGNTYIEEWQAAGAQTPINTPPEVVTFPLANIDNARTSILAKSGATAWNIPNHFNELPYGYLTDANASGVPYILSNQEGLAIKTYQSDLFNNWLKTEYVDAINEASAIDTSGGSFNVETFILARKIYDILNRVAVSDGTYNSWLDAVWGEERMRRAETPMYCGGLIRELVFQEVVSNSQTDEQPLGSLAGKGIMAGKRKGGKIIVKADEPSYLIGLVSLTPRIDYSQGNDWDNHLLTMDDLKKPGLDGIGFQDLIQEQFAWWTTETTTDETGWTQKSAGKQPAWLNYMTDVNRTYGNFAIANSADGEMFMTLNRRYEWDVENPGEIVDLTTYIDPTKFNFIFASTALDAQNFWCQIAVDITARRKMSAKLMPNL